MQIVNATAGIIFNSRNQLLITKRRREQFMGGFWELPGGKIEDNESTIEAITRELKEELAIDVLNASVDKQITHNYIDRNVNLVICNINNYQGTPIGAEGQDIAWVDMQNLSSYKLLPTMHTLFAMIISLPNKYWITPLVNNSATLVDVINNKLAQGIQLIQLRSKVIINTELIKKIHANCKVNKTRLLLNTINKTFDEPYADGWHLTSAELLELDSRPCGHDKLLAASVHTLAQIQKAQDIGVDFVVLSPIKATTTHPQARLIGWDAAVEIVKNTDIALYFLGGMKSDDLHKALQCGAIGIAGISGF